MLLPRIVYLNYSYLLFATRRKDGGIKSLRLYISLHIWLFNYANAKFPFNSIAIYYIHPKQNKHTQIPYFINYSNKHSTPYSLYIDLRLFVVSFLILYPPKTTLVDRHSVTVLYLKFRRVKQKCIHDTTTYSTQRKSFCYVVSVQCYTSQTRIFCQEQGYSTGIQRPCHLTLLYKLNPLTMQL